MAAQKESSGRTQTNESMIARVEKAIDHPLKHHASAYETRENARAKIASISIIESKKRTSTVSYAAGGCILVDAENLKTVAIVIAKI
jgi:glutamine amidotransferase-like uncharacterized protein